MPWPTTPPSVPLPLLFFVSGTAVIPHVLGWTVLSLSGTTSPHPTPEFLERGWCVPLLGDACATSGHYFSQFTVTADFSRERTTADSGQSEGGRVRRIIRRYAGSQGLHVTQSCDFRILRQILIGDALWWGSQVSGPPSAPATLGAVSEAAWRPTEGMVLGSAKTGCEAGGRFLLLVMLRR